MNTRVWRNNCKTTWDIANAMYIANAMSRVVLPNALYRFVEVDFYGGLDNSKIWMLLPWAREARDARGRRGRGRWRLLRAQLFDRVGLDGSCGGCKKTNLNKPTKIISLFMGVRIPLKLVYYPPASGYITSRLKKCVLIDIQKTK